MLCGHGRVVPQENAEELEELKRRRQRERRLQLEARFEEVFAVMSEEEKEAVRTDKHGFVIGEHGEDAQVKGMLFVSLCMSHVR